MCKPRLTISLAVVGMLLFGGVTANAAYILVRDDWVISDNGSGTTVLSSNGDPAVELQQFFVDNGITDSPSWGATTGSLTLNSGTATPRATWSQAYWLMGGNDAVLNGGTLLGRVSGNGTITVNDGATLNYATLPQARGGVSVGTGGGGGVADIKGGTFSAPVTFIHSASRVYINQDQDGVGPSFAAGVGYLQYGHATFASSPEVHLYGYDLALTADGTGTFADGTVTGYWDEPRTSAFTIDLKDNGAMDTSSYVTLHEIPEPATLALLGFGATVLGLRRRLRRA